jgi:hypothetical protein
MSRDIRNIAPKCAPPKKVSILEECKLRGFDLQLFVQLMGHAVTSIPSDFPRNCWTDHSYRPDENKPGWWTSAPKDYSESDVNYLIRWRIHYATAAYRAISDLDIVKELQTPISANES